MALALRSLQKSSTFQYARRNTSYTENKKKCSENCTKIALRLHGRRASFFIQLHQKEGAEMYDNDWIYDLQLDDDLFFIEDEDDKNVD